MLHKQCCQCVGLCWRRWLPRTKLDPLGVDAALDGVKLTANNKANVCAAVQRAFDRARPQTTVTSVDVSTASETAAAAAATEQSTAACDDTLWLRCIDITACVGSVSTSVSLDKLVPSAVLLVANRLFHCYLFHMPNVELWMFWSVDFQFVSLSYISLIWHTRMHAWCMQTLF